MKERKKNMISSISTTETIKFWRIISQDEVLCDKYKKEYEKRKADGENKNKIIKELSAQMESEITEDVSENCWKYAALLKYTISRVDFADIIEVICK